MNSTCSSFGCRPPTWPSLVCGRRVIEGGHHVPEETIRRRYEAGLKNFFRIYRPLAASWRFYDNSVHGDQRLIAIGDLNQATMVFDADLWNNVNREWT